MNRLVMFLFCVPACVLLCAPVNADDPPKKLTPEERKALEAKLGEMNAAGFKAYQAGMTVEATKAFREALEIARRAYTEVEFPDGHINLAASLNNLAVLLKAQGRLAEAEPLLKDALGMNKRLFKGDHPQVAASLNNLAALHQDLGKLAEAEPFVTDALDMRKRLFKGDHPQVANSLVTLGLLLRDQGKLAEAEPFVTDALDMRRRLFKGDHPDLATSLNNLAVVLEAQGKWAEAESLYNNSLDMRKRLFKGDHPQVAVSLNNLGLLLWAQEKLAEAEPLLKDALDMRKRLFKGDHPELATSLAVLLEAQGELAEAEPLLKDALDMRKRLYKGDHPDLATSLTNLGALHRAQGKLVEADRLYRKSLALSRRMTAVFASQKSEGETLTLVATGQLTRSGFLSNAREQGSPTSTVYPEVWLEKGAIARVFEQRQLRARVAATDPALALQLAEPTDARRRRAELLLAPVTNDPGTLTKRADELKALETKIREFEAALSKRFPVVARIEKLNAATVADLQRALPVDAAVIDFLHYTFFEHDKNKPGKAGDKQTPRYVAFVVTRDKVSWVDLETADKIDTAVGAWRGAITSGRDILAEIPAKVRELIWAKVRKEIPAGVKTLYICPDEALCRVPWVALPGDKPGTILLEEYAIATIPHAPFLLDKLWPQDTPKDPPTATLAVGGVKYDAELNSPAPNATASRGDPLLKPDAKPSWGFLRGTVAEVNGVTASAVRKKFPVIRIEGDAATSAAVVAALPKAKYAHFATHGFFSDPTFRSVFQLDEKDFEQSRRGERIGKAANTPLVMTGLVFAGANNPKTPGRGIVTGEALVDLDLSGLELAVLSACESGLGDVAGGEGTFGLQRAFHYAGTNNVVASLWKVPDQPTAAVMAEFYRNLWTQDLSPMESLRQAQLTIYRNPAKIADLAAGFRGKFEVVPGAVDEGPMNTGTTTHPLKWAGFSLSGLGR